MWCVRLKFIPTSAVSYSAVFTDYNKVLLLALRLCSSHNCHWKVDILKLRISSAHFVGR